MVNVRFGSVKKAPVCMQYQLDPVGLATALRRLEHFLPLSVQPDVNPTYCDAGLGLNRKNRELFFVLAFH